MSFPRFQSHRGLTPKRSNCSCMRMSRNRCKTQSRRRSLPKGNVTDYSPKFSISRIRRGARDGKKEVHTLDMSPRSHARSHGITPIALGESRPMIEMSLHLELSPPTSREKNLFPSNRFPRTSCGSVNQSRIAHVGAIRSCSR